MPWTIESEAQLHLCQAIFTTPSTTVHTLLGSSTTYTDDCADTAAEWACCRGRRRHMPSWWKVRRSFISVKP